MLVSIYPFNAEIKSLVHSSLYRLIFIKVYVYVIYQLFCNIRDLLNLS